MRVPVVRTVRRPLLRAGGALIVLALMGSNIRADARPGDVKTVLIPVEGMVCFACAASVKRTLRAIDGVVAVEVSLETRSARVAYTPSRVTPERLVTAIDKLGSRAGTPKDDE